MATIFVTAGTQLPFDRLLSAVDSWCDTNPGHNIYVQAFTEENNYRNFSVQEFLAPQEYKNLVSTCDVLIGHAGMGTIITAHEYGLPVIIMPRQFELGEHRNNHQSVTAQKFRDVKGVYVIDEPKDLCMVLSELKRLEPCSDSSVKSRQRLHAYVKNFIEV